MLVPRAVKCAATPFATGGYSDVYKATFKGRPVAIKKLKVTTVGDPKKVHRVSFLSPIKESQDDRSHWALSSSPKK